MNIADFRREARLPKDEDFSITVRSGESGALRSVYNRWAQRTITLAKQRMHVGLSENERGGKSEIQLGKLQKILDIAEADFDREIALLGPLDPGTKKFETAKIAFRKRMLTAMQNASQQVPMEMVQ